jgi:serine/threonine protein kinase
VTNPDHPDEGTDPADRATQRFGGEPAPAGEPEVGGEIDDFLLVDKLGEGAFAQVFLAHQKSLHRTVALKISAARSEEAQTLAQLDHPNIVRVFDQRQVPGRGLHLLYMEYVPAGTLEPVIEMVKETPAAQRTGAKLLEIVDAALEKRGEEPPVDSRLRERLADATWPEVVAILGSHLAVALDYAHGQGVLHRDVKPANVLLGASGRAKLADFNISWSSEIGSSAAEYLGGSLPYMSPEQVRAASPFHEGTAEDLDRRSDIYSLGIVLWELLTGHVPLPKPEQGEGWKTLFGDLLASRSAGVPAATISDLPADVPPALREILLACLAPDPADRPATGAQLARRLELCLHRRARELMSPPRAGPARLFLALPLAGFLVIALATNAALSYLNIQYNVKAVVEESEWQDFWHQVEVVNGIGFPIGIAVLVWMIFPVARAARRRRRGEMLEAGERTRLRRRALRMGGTMAAVLLPLWIIGGLVFPIWHHVSVGHPHEGGYFHFTLSNALFGVLAATACFFFINFLTARLVYARLIEPGDLDVQAVAQMERLKKRLGWYFTACTLVPFISILMLTMPFIPLGTMRPVFGALGVMGTAGFAVTYWLIAQIRRDVDALQVVLGPQRGRLGAGL